VEIVNLRMRMIAEVNPTHQRARARAGDGCGACYAERDVFFDGRFVKARLYHRDGLVPGDAISGPAMITEYSAATALPL